jgi:hypothetical protein
MGEQATPPTDTQSCHGHLAKKTTPVLFQVASRWTIPSTIPKCLLTINGSAPSHSLTDQTHYGSPVSLLRTRHSTSFSFLPV